jgi:hypoxanthine-guanine phosphoribosyltransferase
MQDSYSELIKLLLPEIIVEYFELTSYKKEMKSSTLPKEVNRFLKNIGNLN